jgi:hypothetical protein
MARIACVLAVVAGCGTAPCATGAQADGRYTLALDGVCLEDVGVARLASGSWEAAGTSLGWEAAASGGLLVTLASDAPAQALELAIPELDVDEMLQQGYQSWGFSGTVLVPLDVALDDDGRPRMKAARTGSALDEVRGVSFHSAVFRKGDAGPVVLVAALSATRAVTGIAASHDLDAPARLSILYGPQREPLPADGDGSVRSEVLYVATAATPEAALAQLTAELVHAHAADGFAPARPPGGWFSWNNAFTEVDATLVRGELDTLANRLLPAGMPLVEIDDGWENAWGDWRDNAKFPDGMPALAAEIRARGLVAGVWLAPFLVDTRSPIASATDPALFVHGADGRPLVHTSPGIAGSFYVLDGTNPASMAIATDQIRRLAAGGLTFFKLDFLYAGALVGTRAHVATGVEALRLGLAQIRQAAGAGAILNACGAPILPMLGLADSLRVGADTAFAGVDEGFMMVAGAARSLAARAHLFPLVWPDADQAQLRAPLTTDEARVSAVSAALAGAPYALGDDLATLDPARLALALDPVVLDLSGAAAPATPEGIMTDPAGSIPLSPLLENGLLTPPPATLHATGKSGATYAIAFDWTAHTVAITR